MKKYFYFATAALLTFASCANDDFVGGGQEQPANEGGAIRFESTTPNMTRALKGATAAEKLGGMFIVNGVKGTTAIGAGATATTVYDNYLVLYGENTSNTTESNTDNWEYVGKETDATKLTSGTWTALHPLGTNQVQAQSIKYWDYSTDEYNFIAYSTGSLQATSGDAAAGTSAKVTRISNIPAGYTIGVKQAADIEKCYYTDVNTVLKANYAKPVELQFKSLAAKVRVGLYETIPGYSVKDVKFYTAAPTVSSNTITPATGTSASLYSASANLAQSGTIAVTFPKTDETSKTSDPTNHDRATISVTPETSTNVSVLSWGNLTNKAGKEKYEADASDYLGRTSATATFAGATADNYYKAVFPSSAGTDLTLSVDYTLLSTDGSGEEIHVYAAKAVVPSTYTKWLPNYAYTYLFKISDNTNGWTSKLDNDPAGLYPITFDAVIVDTENAEQSTITTVATPSITTYQFENTYAANEFQKKADKVYAMVMNSGTAVTFASTVNDLTVANGACLYTLNRAATEAEVMDALLKQASVDASGNITGRNAITLTKNANIAVAKTIEKGVDGNPVDVDGTDTKAAAIDANQLTAATYYAFVYVQTAKTGEKDVRTLAADASSTTFTNYYEVTKPDAATATVTTDGTAQAGKVYFAKNTTADGTFASWTYIETKVGDSVTGLYEATLPNTKATGTYDTSKVYIDKYVENEGKYAVKVIKIKD